MREILLVFILALIIGSIINGWPKPPVKRTEQQAPAHIVSAAQSNSLNPVHPEAANLAHPDLVNMPATEGTRRDFPDFNSFPYLNQDNFSNLVLASAKPVFILCYSPNNLSYERMVPLVAALAQDHADSIQVARLNVIENTSLGQKYGIYSVPTYLVFAGGELRTRLVGIVSKDKLEAMLKPVL